MTDRVAFPEIRLGVVVDERRPAETVDAMRRAIHEGSYESHLIRNALQVAAAQGMSGEDRYVYLAYHALVALETYFQRELRRAHLYPDPLMVVDPVVAPEAEALAAHIARRVFEIGSGHNAVPATRIQFMLGRPERPGGGFAEEPLADFIAKAIAEYSAANTEGKP